LQFLAAPMRPVNEVSPRIQFSVFRSYVSLCFGFACHITLLLSSSSASSTHFTFLKLKKPSSFVTLYYSRYNRLQLPEFGKWSQKLIRLRSRPCSFVLSQTYLDDEWQLSQHNQHYFLLNWFVNKNSIKSIIKGEWSNHVKLTENQIIY